MKKQIANVSVIRSSFIVAIVGAIVSAIYWVPFALYEIFKLDHRELGLEILWIPLIHLVVAFIAAIITFFVYNVVAKAFGGIEITTQDKIG